MTINKYKKLKLKKQMILKRSFSWFKIFKTANQTN